MNDKTGMLSGMMYDIYMEGVNMTGEYQGCWVRFKDIEKIVNKYMTEYNKEDVQNAYDFGYQCGYTDAMEEIYEEE